MDALGGLSNCSHVQLLSFPIAPKKEHILVRAIGAIGCQFAPAVLVSKSNSRPVALIALTKALRFLGAIGNESNWQQERVPCTHFEVMAYTKRQVLYIISGAALTWLGRCSEIAVSNLS